MLFDFKPLPNGTTVKEVDANGKLIGRQFLSTDWNTRDRPENRTDGCAQWINNIVVSETLAGANLGGRALVTPNATIASSSPSSRDVIAIVVDQTGATLEVMRAPFVLVPKSVPTIPPSDTEIAQEIWFSQVPFNPETTPVAKLEKTCLPINRQP